MGSTLPDDFVHDTDGGIRVERIRHQIAERLPGVFVEDVEDLDGPSRDGDVELVVQRP